MSASEHPPPEATAEATDPSPAIGGAAPEAIARLVAVMARLRAPDGCPWDREQDLMSLRPYLIEETYELLEAIEAGDVEAHREELGDVLLQVVFQAQIRQEEGRFGLAEVAQGIADKLIRRHPHVFEGVKVQGPEDLHRRWAEIKAEEKPERRSALDGVPRALPALLRAARVTEKASRVGFDWPDAQGPWDKLAEEQAELSAAVAGGDTAQITHELGDLLLSVVNLSRFLGVSAEDALGAAVDRFRRRFQRMEATLNARGQTPQQTSLKALEALWQAAKQAEQGE